MAYSTFMGLAIASGVFAWLSLIVVYDMYARWSEPTVVHCPGTDSCAAIATSFDGRSLAVARCSHWPNLSGCSQACLNQRLPGPI